LRKKYIVDQEKLNNIVVNIFEKETIDMLYYINKEIQELGQGFYCRSIYNKETWHEEVYKRLQDIIDQVESVKSIVDYLYINKKKE
jgi:hypothetical protein